MAFFVPLLTSIGGGSATAGATVGLSAAATGLSAYSAVASGVAQSRAARANAAQIETAAGQRAAEDRENIRRERASGKLFLGRQRARIASSGILASTGSPLEVLGRTAGQVEMRAQEMARVSVSEYGASFAKAAATRYEGRQAKRAGIIQGFGNLLSGGAQTLETGARLKYLGA